MANAEELPSLVLPAEDRDYCLGPMDARFTLVEYGDFACPHCRHVAGIVKELTRELEDELCFVFRAFPQPKLYPHAQFAAEAAEAAGMRGKFWLMHDRLFDHQPELDEKVIRRIAGDLPLDMQRFDDDLRSGDPARRVAEDVESGTEAGVGDTPCFFVNGIMHVGSYEFLPLLQALKTSKSA